MLEVPTPFTLAIDEVEIIPGTAETLVRRKLTNDVLEVLGTETLPDGRAFLWARLAGDEDQDRANWMVEFARDYRDRVIR